MLVCGVDVGFGKPLVAVVMVTAVVVVVAVAIEWTVLVPVSVKGFG